MAEYIFHVEGMSCGHCVETVKNAVGGMAGVQNVSVDLDKKEVTVAIEGEWTELSEVADKIREAGFEVPAG